MEKEKNDPSKDVQAIANLSRMEGKPDLCIEMKIMNYRNYELIVQNHGYKDLEDFILKAIKYLLKNELNKLGDK